MRTEVSTGESARRTAGRGAGSSAAGRMLNPPRWRRSVARDEGSRWDAVGRPLRSPLGAQRSTDPGRPFSIGDMRPRHCAGQGASTRAETSSFGCSGSCGAGDGDEPDLRLFRSRAVQHRAAENSTTSCLGGQVARNRLAVWPAGRRLFRWSEHCSLTVWRALNVSLYCVHG